MNHCLFCDQIISNYMYTCRAHVSWYKEYKDTEWCKELLNTQKINLRIAKRECVSLWKLAHMELDSTFIPYGNIEVSLEKILKLKEQGYNHKQIAHILRCSVSAVTVKIYREKKKQYTRKHNNE